MPENNPLFKVNSNGFEFTLDKKTIDSINFAGKSPTEFNVIHEFRSVNAAVMGADPFCKHMTVEVEGEKYEIEIKDELEQMLDQMGFSAVSNKHIKEIKAPMPGMVLSITVTEGQAVAEGDRLLILVAMKMENSIIISAPAIIKKILIVAGQAVDKGQVLIELE